ncbi:MAG: LacI family DNA-binding transcriptional regulator [Lentisphaeria bacterium]|nr:LacI family DNA-binding transcriptional regulator [Lentisphaeria bacterium]
MAPAEKHITLKDLASLCHVSIMTASRAFRQNAVISPETRSRILRAAHALNYYAPDPRGRPGHNGRRRPRQIQLIFGIRNGNTAYFHMRLLTAVEQQLALRGFECVIRTATGDCDIFRRLLDNAVRHRCSGTMIMGDFPQEQFKALLDALPGAVLLDAPEENGTEGACSSFSFDNRSAAVLGVDHLIRDCGRKRILLVNGSVNHFFSNEILAGYRAALGSNGIPFDERLVLHTDFSAADAAGALREFIRGAIPFDAVFTNDEMATGVYRVLQEEHIAIPERVSVCGCDDLPVGKQLFPELTSISLDYETLARHAAEYISDGSRRLGNAARMKLAPVLRPGASTAKSS